MSEPLSQKISICLSTKLLQKIDNLAEYSYANRSDIIRQALVTYVHDPSNVLIADPNAVVMQKAYEYIKDDHPYLDPNDFELIQFIYEQKLSEKLHKAV
jgi:predicted DNA-binding protein